MKKTISLLLLFAMIITMFSVPAMAATEKQTVTEHFVDDNGESIAESQKSTSDAKDAPEITGYTYSSQKTETTHVYTEDHITYIIGYPDGGVKVEQHMTRAEAATVLYRLYNGRYPSYTQRMSNITFSDVSSSAWYYKEVETLYNAGVIEASASGKFRPDDAITRAEFAVMCARYDGLTYVDKAKFGDVQRGHWAYSYINAAAEKGWIKGYPDGKFYPDKNITRAEVMALVNRLFNRPVSLDRLPKNVNPYNDIVESHWAYCDAMEATVKHDTADWHELEYNDGVVNIVIERFVDTYGKEISKSVTTDGKANYHPDKIQGYTYAGYVTEITYIYSGGKSAPSIVKTASVSEASVGDTVTYTIKITNGSRASAGWQNVTVTDNLPANLNFVHGSVYINGVHADYSYKNGTLSVPAGNVEIGKTTIVKFDAVIASTAYGETIYNKVIAKGSNGGPVTDTDGGVIVGQGDIQPWVTKSPDTDSAIVGQTLTYTISVGNMEGATYSWEKAIVTDTLPDGLRFVDGSVYLDGATKAYTYKNGILSIELGDIEPGESCDITFKAVVRESAYGSTIYNVAVGAGNNIPDVTAPDDGVVVEAGRAVPTAVKTANKTSAAVGDTIIYTVKVSNGANATAVWKNASMTDTLSDHLTFTYGSVQVNGEAAAYSYKAASRELSVKLGDIAKGETVTITFAVTVNAGAYGKIINNTAILSGDNIDDFEAPDNGVIIGIGAAEPSVTKTANKKTASVGDTIQYTITAENDRHASVAWENVIMTDTIPGTLTFTHGSVQVGGKSAPYSYSGGVLTVELGDIEPNTSKTVTFEAVVNSTAYNTTIRNTAILEGDNTDDPVEASDDGVTIGKGNSEGTATKTANVATAEAGDPITYTIAVKNSSLASYPWENATITDAIPEYLTFIDGSVQIGGRASTDYSFDNGTLKIYLGDIAPGATVTATFRAKVNADAQGQFIVNTAYVSGDNHDTIPTPDKGVEIGAGQAMPSASKSANVHEAAVGDIITYTVMAANNIQATANWKDVVITDVLPETAAFVHGSVYVGGKSVSYSYENRVLTVRLGDIVPGDSVSMKFEVRVTEAAQGKKIYNTAYINSGNSEQIIVSDEGVTVPVEDFGGDEENSVYGSKTADKISVKHGELITYTIVAGNSSKSDITWYDVHLYDIIDTGLSKIVIDTVTIDGQKASEAERSYRNGQLIVKLGAIEPGQEVTVTFQVKVTSEAAGELISNTATLKGSNASGGTYNTSVRISLATNIPAEDDDKPKMSDMHVLLFDGFGANVTYTDSNGDQYEEIQGHWMPEEYMSRAQLAVIFYRLLAKPVLTDTQVIADVETSYWAYTEIQYALSERLFVLDNNDNFLFSDRCTKADLGRLFTMVYGNNFGFTSNEKIKRIDVALAIIEYTSRSSHPEINGASLPYFPDIPTNYKYYWEVMEVSTDHDWYLDSKGAEYWDN